MSSKNIYDTIGGRELIDRTIPSIQEDLNKIADVLTEQRHILRTTLNYPDGTLVVESTETTTKKIISLARECRDEIYYANNRVYNWIEWRKVFSSVLPKDCKIVEEIITL